MKSAKIISATTMPFTMKRLVDWAGAQVVHDARIIVDQGLVLKAEYDPPYIKGAILHNNHEFRTKMRILKDGNVENECPCYTNRERGLICPHVIALALTLVRRAADPERQAKHLEEERRAKRLAQINEQDYIKRVTANRPGSTPATIIVELDYGWMDGVLADNVKLRCLAHYDGCNVPLDEVPRDKTLLLSKNDEALLFVLEDISEGPAKGALAMSTRDFINLLHLMRNRAFHDPDGNEILVHDSIQSAYLKIDILPTNGHIQLAVHTDLPFLPPGDEPFYIVSGKTGWVYGADHFWPLKRLLPEPYHEIYRSPIDVRREDVLRFMQGELPMLGRFARIETEISPDLFTIKPAKPHFRLEVHGSPASLSAVLYARYNDLELVAFKPDVREHFAIPDPDDIMSYNARNRHAERLALDLLSDLGLVGTTGDSLTSIVGERQVLNFLGGSIPLLRRQGWTIDMHGKIAPQFDNLTFATPVVKIEDDAGKGWFDVGFDFEDSSGGSISGADVRRALNKGESFLDYQGKRILIDRDAVESMLSVFEDCDSTDGMAPGHFRMSNIYAPFVKSSLNSLDGIDIDEPPVWRQRAEQTNRVMKLKPVPLQTELAKKLRPYQIDGLNWLRFMEENSFCGLLADEMGLGKTLQTLAWLELERANPDARGLPALIVCPTSLVYNWCEEIKRFCPDMKALPISGANRHVLWDEIPHHDVVLTSYALLRRDIDHYAELEFSAAILDEAQHIKNRSTSNAKAAKQIVAYNRLVLTGTPVENSVADIWSIMDFLMPGYLGKHKHFRANYELPIAKGGPDGELAQMKLRRKLHPFLLRRLKKDVAKDLPPKIKSVQSCTLSPDQATVYKEILSHTQRKIKELVQAKGFNSCRMQIFSLMLKLRQICCHLELLKLKDLDAARPSAKMELFFELVNEAIDGGHRILVFSQFVTMLHILRDNLKQRNIEFCYLDGSTKDRMEQVHRFNTKDEIPIFLISLKAGGTGLNLTGADMVIHYDPWWNPAVEEQATDRAYRIGQQRTVYSVKLITKGTIEEKVLEMQKKKQAVIDATIESDQEIPTSMTWEDVQELLEL